MFLRARTCPPSFPREREPKGREEGNKGGRRTVEIKAKPVTPAFQSCFQRMEEEGGEFAERGGDWFRCVARSVR